MNKKEFWFVFVIILFFSVQVLAQSDTGSGSGVDQEAEKILNATRKLQKFTGDEKWEYLGAQLNELLLKIEGIALIDLFFRKINIAFFFIFGENYDLSLTFLFAVFLWIFFFSMFGRGIVSFSTFSKPVAYIIAFILAGVLAHLKVYNYLSMLIFKVLFFREGIWRWTSFVLFFVIYIFILIYFKSIIWKLGRSFKTSQEEKEKWDEKFQRQDFSKRAEGLEKAFSGVEDALHK